MANQSWAPQSPDLSAYAPQSPDLSAYKSPTTALPTALPNNLSWTGPQSPNLAGLQPSFTSQPEQALVLDGGPWDNRKAQIFDPQYNLSPQQLHHPQQQQPYELQQQPLYPGPHYGAPDPMPQTRGQRLKAEDHDEDWAPQASPVKQAASRGRKVKTENSGVAAATAQMQRMDTQGVEVKTKFPTARIKRIMQADEDVGKVAQVTPVVMAKALELFMIRLISSSAGVARSRGSKRVLTAHMKAAVMQDDQFDNLREIVDKVPDAPAKGGGAAEDDDDDAEGGGKKRKKSTAAGAKGKKRRNSDDDD